MIGRIVLAFALVLGLPTGASAAAWPEPQDGTYLVPQFRFADGETMQNLRLHYVTLGTPHRDAAGHVDNAVLVLHGTGGDTTQFLSDRFAGILFVPGGILDAAKYFVVITDGIGHGKSSKPSDGLHARFPHYGYRDMVRAQHDVLVEALHVDHLRLVIGTSMGGMQTWLWGETYPTMMDALVPLASLPIQISGRNRVWRDMIVDDLRNDPGYAGGEYKTQPRGLKSAVDTLWILGSAPLYDQSLLPTRDAADAYYENTVKPHVANYDANDMIYQFESSRDYDPQPDLGKIIAPLLAINSADDEINPPELRIMEHEIKHVRHGRFVLLPTGFDTRGHGTHTLPAVWSYELRDFLNARFDVKLARSADGRFAMFGQDGAMVQLPAGWLADIDHEHLHELHFTFRPPDGNPRLTIILSGAHYASPTSLANGQPLCFNGIRGQFDPEASTMVLWIPEAPSRLLREVYIGYEYGDEQAGKIARSFRIPGLRTKC